MEVDEKNTECNDDVFYKRRSSILKPKDDTTRLQSQNPGFRRRVSFHNLRKVQEFDNDNCDLHREIQEEPLHLTNNSDNLKVEQTMSTSYVAGANHYQEAVETSMTLTFLDGPQAVSTPHARNKLADYFPALNTSCSIAANTTFNVFKNAEIGDAAVNNSFEATKFHDDGMQDETLVIFQSIGNAENKENLNKTPEPEPQTVTNNILIENGDEMFVDNGADMIPPIHELDPDNGADMIPPIHELDPGISPEDISAGRADDLLSESRWSQAFHNDESFTRLPPSNDDANRTHTLIDFTEAISAPVSSGKPAESFWFANGESQPLIDDIDVNHADLLQLSSVFGESIMAQSHLMSRHFSRRILSDTTNTKQIGQLAFNEPVELSEVFDDKSFNLSASRLKSGAAIVAERSLLGSSRRSLHTRRRSSILVPSTDSAENTFALLRKSALNSPSLIATNETFSATVLDLAEAQCQLEEARVVHERKQRLYDFIEKLLNINDEFHKEEHNLHMELRVSFEDLISKTVLI